MEKYCNFLSNILGAKCIHTKVVFPSRVCKSTKTVDPVTHSARSGEVYTLSSTLSHVTTEEPHTHTLQVLWGDLQNIKDIPLSFVMCNYLNFWNCGRNLGTCLLRCLLAIFPRTVASSESTSSAVMPIRLWWSACSLANLLM